MEFKVKTEQLDKHWIDQFIGEEHKQNVAIAAAIFLVLVTILALYLIRRRNRSSGAVLIMGLSDAGKTALFTRLVLGKVRDTVTSMTTNSGAYRWRQAGNGRELSRALIDVPGYEKLRQRYIDELRSGAASVLFVVDGGAFQRQLKDVAQLLYQILTDPVLSLRPTLVVVGKQDAPLAKSAEATRAMLETEFNLLRRTQTATLGSEPTSGGQYIGRRDRAFTFADATRPVEFCEAQLLGGEEQIDEVTAWLERGM